MDAAAPASRFSHPAWKAVLLLLVLLLPGGSLILLAVATSRALRSAQERPLELAPARSPERG